VNHATQLLEPLAVRWWPSLLVGSACVGLAAANGAGAPAAAVGASIAALVVSGWLPPLRAPALAVALLVAGWWWGSVRLEALDRSALVAEIGHSGAAEVVVTSLPRRTEFAVRVFGEIRSYRDVPLRERVLLRLPVGRSPPQGAVVAVRVRVEAPRPARDGFDERAWLARRGVHVVLHGGEWHVVGRRGGVGGVSDRLRRHLAGAVAAGVGGERRAVLVGIVLGEDEGLSDELQRSFKASGLYHLLAVSGQNVAIVAGTLLGLFWLLGLPRAVGHMAAIVAICGYVLAVGWQPSVVRAGVAGALVSLTWLLARPADRWHFLLLGAAVLLAWSPRSLFEPGFQLSFAAVAAIFTLVPRLERALEGYPLPRWLRLVAAVSTACGAATAPILWLQFGQVPLYSLLANALATSAMGPLLALALVGALVEPLAPSAALALAWVNGWIAAYLAWCARAVARLPFAEVASGAAVAALLLVPLGLLLLRRLPRWRRRGAVACAAAVLPALLVWQLWPHPTVPPPRGLRVTFLDVGQGDAILLEVPEGAVLVDQGPPEARVADQLRELGVRRLAALVLTHPERDHVGGAAEVVRRVAVDRILDPGLTRSSPYRRETLDVAVTRRIPVVQTRAGASWRLGRLELRALWPERPGTQSDDPNDLAIVLLATYGSVDALLPADAETDVTARLLGRRVEILKVGHHGSADPGLERELRELRPALAVISCGRSNSYGHPHPQTLAALATVRGIRVQRTDRDGRVVVETDGTAISVRTQR
jgi:competence protein ComEC